MDLELWQVLLLALCGMAAGFVDSVSGGGGLLTVPALLWTGLPAATALGTNKLQAAFGTMQAVRHYARAGLVRWKEVRVGVLITFLAAATGTWCVTQWLSTDVLKKIVPWLLIAVAVYTALSPRLGGEPRPARLPRAAFLALFGILLGFYDGFFGPGTGSFWTIACVSLCGMELRRATAFTKVMNLTSNLAALLIFSLSGHVSVSIAMPMIAGQLIGGRLGAKMVIRDGAKIIRPVLIITVLAMAAKLLYDARG